MLDLFLRGGFLTTITSSSQSLPIAASTRVSFTLWSGLKKGKQELVSGKLLVGENKRRTKLIRNRGITNPKLGFGRDQYYCPLTLQLSKGHRLLPPVCVHS